MTWSSHHMVWKYYRLISEYLVSVLQMTPSHYLSHLFGRTILYDHLPLIQLPLPPPFLEKSPSPSQFLHMLIPNAMWMTLLRRTWMFSRGWIVGLLHSNWWNSWLLIWAVLSWCSRTGDLSNAISPTFTVKEKFKWYKKDTRIVSLHWLVIIKNHWSCQVGRKTPIRQGAGVRQDMCDPAESMCESFIITV